MCQQEALQRTEMKFGVNTFIWGAMFGPSDFHLLPAIKANGFDGIEVPILDPGTFDAAAVGRELDRIGLERTAVTIVPGGTSLASSDASRPSTGVRRISKRALPLRGTRARRFLPGRCTRRSAI